MKNNNVYAVKNSNPSIMKVFLLKKKLMSLIFLLMGTFFCSLLTAAELEQVLFSNLPSGTVQINLKGGNNNFPEPKVFKTQNPARIVFDFPGLKSSLKKTDYFINSGKVQSLKVVEVSDRTRLVLNLTGTASHDISQSDGQFIILVDGASTSFKQTKPKAFTKQTEVKPGRKIKKVDFRRTKKAGGRVVIQLSDPDTLVNVGQKDGEVVVDFKNTSIDTNLEKSLDVTDFATTVSSIDTFQNENNVRMVISPSGEYQQISFQNGDIFTVILDPIIIEEEQEKTEEVDENGYSGERLSLNFQRLEVRSALSVISDFTGLNIIASDDVTGELTLNLKDVPWDQALDVILETKGLAKRQKGNVIWVAPARRIAEFEREQLRAAQSSAALEPLVSEVVAINYARAEDLRDVILDRTDTDRNRDRDGRSDQERPVIFLQQTGAGVTEAVGEGESESGDLTITADERTNSLIITTTRSNLISVKALIAELDTPVRQVMVETRIVDASDTFSKELGARLGFTRLTENAQSGISSSSLGDTVVGSNISGNNAVQQSLIDGNDVFASGSGPGNLNVDLGANGINGLNPASYAFSLFRAGTGFANIINLELSALEASGRGKIISSPRLVTSNQQTAEISTGQTVFVTVTNAEGNSVTETRDAFLSLNVTPQINPDDNIILDVEIAQDFFLADGSIQRNNITTQVTVENGETVIIGGIYQEAQSESITKVPLLGDIPILGNLFKQRSNVSNRTELLIFLTPKIIDSELSIN